MMKTQKRDTEKKNWLMNVKEKTLTKLLNKMHKCKAILSYCLKRRNEIENVKPKISGTNNSKTMILSSCAICGCKKSIFIKKQEANGLLSSLGIKPWLSKVTLVGPFLF